MKSILDPSFCYTPSHASDIRKTFAKYRRAQRDAAKIAESAQRAADAENARELEQRASDTAAVQAQFARRRIKAVK